MLRARNDVNSILETRSMIKAPIYIFLIIAGVASIAWALPAAHRLRSPFDIGAACLALIGVALLAAGVLLTIIPGFFE